MHRTYRPEVSPAAERDLRKVPRPVQEQIVFEHLPRIQDDPYLYGKPLIGKLK
jgi:mRNA-degrading endonuclease RelE of RelBE toxin-antitoxin system